MDGLAEIRRAEAYSHTEAYTNHELFADGSWLAKPVKTVLDLFPLFADYRELRCLDLGSGVGRNSIPVARAFAEIDCRVDCVDILALAIDKLREYARRFGVEDRLRGIVSSIDDYEIPPAQYDLILAISALEHVCSEEVLERKLVEMRDGVRQGGVVCLIMNTGIEERDKVSGAILRPQFEVNMDTGALQRILQQTFTDWHVIKHGVRHQKYEIPRGHGVSELETDVVTWVVRK